MLAKPKLRVMMLVVLLCLTLTGCLGGSSSSNQKAPTFTVEGIVNGVTYNSPVIPKINLGDETSLKSVTLNGEAFISGTQITDSGDYTLEVVVENKKGETASGSIKFTITKEYQITVTVQDQLGNGLSGIKIMSTGVAESVETDHNGIAILETSKVSAIIYPQPPDLNNDAFIPIATIVQKGDHPTFILSANKPQSRSLNDLTFNPAPFSDPNTFNPFTSPVIREAMNRLIDRQDLVNLINNLYALNAEPVLTFVNPQSFDYEFMSDVIDELDNLYAYDKASAQTTITAEMRRLGAELIDDTWHYLGESIELGFFIRSEDERKNIGDYIADQLRSIGFAVNCKYITIEETGQILYDDPTAGVWHLYAGGWGSISYPVQGHFLYQHFMPTGMDYPLWQTYNPNPELIEVANLLSVNKFNSVSERKQIFKTGLELSLQDSVRIFLTSYEN